MKRVPRAKKKKKGKKRQFKNSKFNGRKVIKIRQIIRLIFNLYKVKTMREKERRTEKNKKKKQGASMSTIQSLILVNKSKSK